MPQPLPVATTVLATVLIASLELAVLGQDAATPEKSAPEESAQGLEKELAGRRDQLGTQLSEQAKALQAWQASLDKTGKALKGTSAALDAALKADAMGEYPVVKTLIAGSANPQLTEPTRMSATSGLGNLLKTLSGLTAAAKGLKETLEGTLKSEDDIRASLKAVDSTAAKLSTKEAEDSAAILLIRGDLAQMRDSAQAALQQLKETSDKSKQVVTEIENFSRNIGIAENKVLEALTGIVANAPSDRLVQTACFALSQSSSDKALTAQADLAARPSSLLQQTAIGLLSQNIERTAPRLVVMLLNEELPLETRRLAGQALLKNADKLAALPGDKLQPILDSVVKGKEAVSVEDLVFRLLALLVKPSS